LNKLALGKRKIHRVWDSVNARISRNRENPATAASAVSDV